MLGRRLLIGVFVCIIAYTSAPAAVVKLTDKEMLEAAETVVAATVISQNAHWDSEHRNIVTDVTVNVDYLIKGKVNGRQMTFTVSGGRVGDIIQEVSDTPIFFEGEQAVLFLQPGKNPIVGGEQGKVPIAENRVIGRKMSLEEYISSLTASIPLRSSTSAPAGTVQVLAPFEYEECVMPAPSAGKMEERAEQSEAQQQIKVASTLLSEGFESGYPTGLWSYSSGTNGYTWGVESFKPYTGSASAWCAGWSTKGQPDLNPAVDNYANSMNAWMRWGPFDLSDATAAQMTFYLWLESESNYDYFKWGSSLDGNAFAMYKTSGTSSGWVQLTLDLTNRLGNSQVWIAFNFTSSSANTFKGAFVDDIVIIKELPDAASPVIYNITPGKASAGTSTRVTISGNNFGDQQGNGCVEFFYRSGQPKIQAPIVSWSNTTIVCEVPIGTVNGYAGSAASGPVTVTTNDGKTSLGYDFIVSFGYGLRRWFSISVPYYINQNSAPISGAAAAIRAAADTWTYDGTADFSLTYLGTCNATSSSYNGKNEIMWAPLGSSGAIAQATCWFTTGGAILENDICFNSSYAWEIGSGSFYDVETIALHEFGHWLSLRDLYGDIGDNINDRSKVMYGFGYTNGTKRELTGDDRDGILYIYGHAPTIDNNWVTHELDMGTAQAQMCAAVSYTLGTAVVYDEFCPLLSGQKAIRLWWAMHALDNSYIRLYFTQAMLADAGFAGSPVIYHYSSSNSWAAVATSEVRTDGNLLYVESLEPVTSWSPFTLMYSGPISVEFMSFEAFLTDKGVELKWRTAQEINVAGYELQRRSEREPEWRTIASFADHDRLTAKGTTEESEYRFLDPSAPDGRVDYRVRAVCLDGSVEPWHETGIILTAVADYSNAPRTFVVRPAFPNPFNPSTTISFDLPQSELVEISVYDVLGRAVAALLHDVLAAGRHQTVWNAEDAPGGIYFIRISAGEFKDLKRVVLLK